MIGDISEWFCCIAPAEKFVTSATSSLFVLSEYAGVAEVDWRLLWLPFSGTGAARQEAYLWHWWLDIVPMPIEEPPFFVNMVVPRNLSTWVSFASYLSSPAAMCPDGCQQSKLPYQT